MNSNYERTSISAISDKLKQDIKDGSEGKDKEVIDAAKTALEVVDAIIEEDIENEVYWDGLNYFMDEPEFQDINITRNVLRIFSDRRGLIRMMRSELPYEGVKVYIGGENSLKMLKDCTVITCGYSLRGRTVGRMGVIGPTRMDYDHALRTVRCLSDLISEKLKLINSRERR